MPFPLVAPDACSSCALAPPPILPDGHRMSKVRGAPMPRAWLWRATALALQSPRVATTLPPLLRAGSCAAGQECSSCLPGQGLYLC